MKSMKLLSSPELENNIKLAGSGLADIKLLENEKKATYNSILNTNIKILKLKKILEDKKLISIKTNILRQPFEETQKTKHGLTVADYRTPKYEYNKINKLYDIPKVIEDIEPCAIKNENIIRIRHQNVRNVIGKKIIADKIKSNEDKLQAIEERKAKSIKKFPKLRIPESMLPNRYIRGELPCTIEHGTGGHYLSWACPLENLDYEYYLPIFFDGLQVPGDGPASFIARQGIEDMLLASKGYPERVLPCLKNLVRPLRNALGKFDVPIMLSVLKALQQLVLSNKEIGEPLLPYAKQFLAPMAAFLDNNKNIGDSIDYGQRKNDDVGEEIRKTLELMEEYGGPSAFEEIKFAVPLYQSCIRKPYERNRTTLKDKAKRTVATPNTLELSLKK